MAQDATTDNKLIDTVTTATGSAVLPVDTSIDPAAGAITATDTADTNGIVPSSSDNSTATDMAGGISAATAVNSSSTTSGPIQITGITSDGSASTSGFITNSSALVIHGTLSQPLPAFSSGIIEYVQVSLNGGQTWGYASVNGTSWTFDNTANTMPDGTYSVQAELVASPAPDPSGMTPLWITVTGQTTQQMVVDTTPPAETLTIVSATQTAINQPPGKDGYLTPLYMTQEVAVTGTLGRALADGSQPGITAEQLQISLDNGATWQNVAVDPGSTTWSYQSSGSTSVATIEARVVDAAGNNGKTVTQTVTAGNGGGSSSGNAIQITGITLDSGASASDLITNDNTLVIHGTLSQSLPAPWFMPIISGSIVSYVQVSLDGGKTWGYASVNGTNWTFDNTAHTMPDGTYNVQAELVEMMEYEERVRAFPAPLVASASGDPSEPMPSPILSPVLTTTVISKTTQPVVVDTAAPSETVTIASTSDGHTIHGTLGSALADGSQPGVSAEQLQISLDDGATWQSVTVDPGSTTWSYDGGVPITNGEAVEARVVDVAGNDGKTVTQTVTVSGNGAIQITGITPDSGISATDFITNDNTLVIHGTLGQPLPAPSSGTIEYVQVSLDGGQTWGYAKVDGTSWTFDNTAHTIPDGTYSVQAELVTTPAPNPSGATTPLWITVTGPIAQQVVVDTTIPSETVTIASTSDGQTLGGTLGNALADGSQPGVSAEQLQISLDKGDTWQNVAVDPGSTTWSYDSGAPITSGAPIEARVTDAAGNDGVAVTQAVSVIHGIAGTADLVIDPISTSSSAGSGTVVSVTDYDSPMIPGEQVQVSLDGGITWQAATESGDYGSYSNWTYQSSTVVTNLSTIEARVVDGSGNFSGLPVNYVEADNDFAGYNFPLISSITDINPGPGMYVNDFVTNSGKLMFDGSLSASGWGSNLGEGMIFSLDGGHSWQNATYDGGSSYTFDDTANPLPDGLYVVEARVGWWDSTDPNFVGGGLLAQ